MARKDSFLVRKTKCIHNVHMKKEWLLAKIEDGWVIFINSIAGLTDDVFMESGVVE